MSVPRSLAALLMLMVSLGASVAVAAPAAEPRVHVVVAGQRLGSIAKRYNVSIEAVCNANGIRRGDLLRPGRRLTIPDRSDKDGSVARSRAAATPPPPPEAPAKTERTAPETPAPKVASGYVHVVASGQRLGSIAKRYRITLDELCQANGIHRNDRIRPGQKLVIPGFVDKNADSRHAESRVSARDDKQDRPAVGAKARRPSWYPYRRKPRRPGYVTLVGYHGQWSGYLVGKGRRVLPAARQAISRVLAWPRERTLMDARLLQLLAQVSDEFGGRTVRLVSGWRNTSFARESRHKRGRAMDFLVPGVPNAALRDYLHGLENVGVGYYPNSTFVHLDTRDTSAFWTDYAGPGEPPRYRRAEADSSTSDDAADTDAKNADTEDAEATNAEVTDEEPQAPKKRPTQESAAVAQ